MLTNIPKVMAVDQKKNTTLETLRRYLLSHEVWVFLFGAILLNAAFIGALSQGILPMKLYNFGRFLLLGLFLAGVVLLARGPRGVISLARPMLVWRIHPAWYLLAFCWGMGMCILTLLGKGLATGQGLSAITMEFHVLGKLGTLVTILVASFVGEIVWVSYSVERLQRKYSIFVASQIVGVFWTLWWMPMVILNVGVIPGLPPFFLLVSMLGIASMCAFIYNHTHSGLAVLVLQVMLNSSLLVLPVTPREGNVMTFAAFGGVYFLAALTLHLCFGKQPLLKSRTQQVLPER